MMRANFDLGGSSVSVQLTKAILIYSGPSESAATVHDIGHERTGPVILPGVGLGKAELHQLLLALLGSRRKTIFLPENVLAISPVQLAWWHKSQKREIFFNGDTEDTKKLNVLSGKKVCHPNLVFVATQKSLRIFAVADNKRPRPETPLYFAPYWNVFEGGKMCRGNTVYPEGRLPEHIPVFEAAFFDTHFTHWNGTPLTRHPEGHFGFWRDLQTAKTVPAKWLVPLGKTLMEVLEHAQD